MNCLVDDQDIVFTGFGLNDVYHGPWLSSLHLAVSDADQVLTTKPVIDTEDPQEIITGPGFQKSAYGLDVFGLADGFNGQIGGVGSGHGCSSFNVKFDMVVATNWPFKTDVVFENG